MLKSWTLKIMAVCAVLAFAIGCASREKKVEVDAARLKMFRPLPAVMESASNPITEAKVELGRMLYYEPRLSKGQDISCNTCHHLEAGGADEQAVTPGHKGLKGKRNAPTVFNAAAHFVQFWDGRAADVEAQAKGPILNPVEMVMPSEKYAVRVLKSMPEYVDAFKQAFPEAKDAVSYDNMAKAIGAFERKLMTPSRWDRFLEGDRNALTDAEKAGFNKFMEAGCQTCHSGTLLGGTMYQKLGVVLPYQDQSDLGRYQVTKQDGDKMMFKVPSLRNIERTAPYYHNGAVSTLEEAIQTMGVYQVGKQLKPAEVASVVTFLKALTGTIPPEYIQAPALPKSTPKTPKADRT